MMKKTLYKVILTLILALSLSGSIFGQGFVERYVKGTEEVETNLHFIYQGTHIPVLDITYHEFSADSLTWRKGYEEGDCYIRFNNYTDNSTNPYNGLEGYHPDSTWWVFNFCTCNGAIPSEIGGIDTLFIYYYHTDTTYIIDTVVVLNGVVDINIPFPDTVTGNTTNFQDTTSHTHQLWVYIGDNQDVDTTGLVDGYVLKYNSITGMWEPHPDLTGGGGGSALTVTEEDNSPSVSNVSEIRVTNSHLTDNGAGSVSLDLTIDATNAENDFVRAGKVRVPSGDNFITFSSALPDTTYIVASVYALLDYNQNRQQLTYDSLAVDGFRVLDVVDSAYVHYIAIRDLDSLLLALDGTGLVYASGTDTLLGFLSNKTDDSTITVTNNELTVLAEGLQHDSLLSLNWADAGHTMDTILNMNSNLIDSVTVINFDTTYTMTGSEPIGGMYWNEDEKTLDLKTSAITTLQMGQEVVLNCLNDTGSDMDNGVPVMFAGTVGASAEIKIQLAIADGTFLPHYMIGVTTEEILNGESGKVTWFGKVRGLRTDGALSFGGLETWNNGDLLYVDPVNAGYLTNVAPETPDRVIFVAAVLYATSGNSGSIFIRPTIQPLLTGLDDVNGTPVNKTGQIVVWNQDSTFFDFDYNIVDTTATVNLSKAHIDTLTVNKITYSDTYWDDLRIPIVASAGGAAAPNLTAFGSTGGILQYAFAGTVTSETSYVEGQFSHKIKETSDISPHIHSAPSTTPVSTDTAVVAFEYTWASINDIFPTSDTIITKIPVCDYAQWQHAITSMTEDIVGIGDQESSIILGRITRLYNDASDTYEHPLFIFTIDIHYEIDKPGSNNMIPD